MRPMTPFEIIESLILVVFVYGVNLAVFTPVLGWLERKQSALMQDRVGANRADILGFRLLGLIHSLTDALKTLMKEDFVPAGANRFFHTLAPFISLTAAMTAFAVIPIGGTYEIYGHRTSLVIADIDWGILFIFATGSLATYGSVLAGWSSNNNWSLLGGLRASAQMLSYEVAMGLSLIGVMMVYGSLRLTDIGAQQVDFFHWGIFTQPLGFVLFLTCAMAENKRPPFDAPEAESELVAGYFTEYSSMKFVMFWMGEFIEMVTISGIMTTLFLGAWHLPSVSDEMLLRFFSFAGDSWAVSLSIVVNLLTFYSKIAFFLVLMMAIRWTLPRFRYDQIMRLGWRIILPAALVNILITGAVSLLLKGGA